MSGVTKSGVTNNNPTAVIYKSSDPKARCTHYHVCKDPVLWTRSPFYGTDRTIEWLKSDRSPGGPYNIVVIVVVRRHSSEVSHE